MKLIFAIFVILNLGLQAKEDLSNDLLSFNEGTSNIKIGGRLQGIFDYPISGRTNDIFIRRARLNLEYQTSDHHLFSLDIRNDDSNKEDGGERTFSLGDAFYEIPIALNLIHNITVFRSKVDVSYSQTASSKDLIHPNRAEISDYAANFVVHNRRAANLQLNGGNDWFTYQLVVSDGIQSDEIETPLDSATVSSIVEQSLTYGAKTRFYLLNDGKKAGPKETFYGKVTSISFGLGFFENSGVRYQLNNGRVLEKSRQLYNAELSIALKSFRLLAEGFFFDGDTTNLSTNTFGKSSGGYLRAEYVFSKIAPFIAVQEFKRDTDNDYSHLRTQMIGINYYELDKVRRYGISFKNYDYGKALHLKNHEEIMAYIMTDY